MIHNASKDEFRAADGDMLAVLDHMPAEKLAALTSRSARRKRFLDNRDKIIRDVAGELFGDLQRGFAPALARALKEFRDRGFDHDPIRDKPKQRPLRRILAANNGKCIGKRQLHSILAGHRTPPVK